MFESFESFVNSKGCKTFRLGKQYNLGFESFVNSKGCKTQTGSNEAII